MEATRPATISDVPRLAELADEAVAEQVDARGGAIWSVREARPLPADQSLAAAVTDPDVLTLVGTIDDTVIAYAVARVDELQDGSLLGIITDIYTEPGARAVGVGEVMIDEIIEWCRGRGCRGIDSLALPGNRSTKNFFETFGFTARAITVHRRLDRPS